MTAVLQIPTRHGHTVNVTADPNDQTRPYRWACTAGDAEGESAYASLPFARDDATAHADTCQARVEHDVVITRAKLYPAVARPGPAWQWTYRYTVDGGPVCQYGTGLASLRRMLRERFGTPGKEAWKS